MVETARILIVTSSPCATGNWTSLLADQPFPLTAKKTPKPLSYRTKQNVDPSDQIHILIYWIWCLLLGMLEDARSTWRIYIYRYIYMRQFLGYSKTVGFYTKYDQWISGSGNVFLLYTYWWTGRDGGKRPKVSAPISRVTFNYCGCWETHQLIDGKHPKKIIGF
jgi:hypothetical protein